MTPPVLEALQIDLADYQRSIDTIDVVSAFKRTGVGLKPDPAGFKTGSRAVAPRGRTCQPILGFRTGLVGDALHETRYDHPVSYGIIRSEFDQYLLCRSRADVKTATPFVSAERVGDRWRVNGAFEARVLVGAGGHFCPVARLLNPARPGGEPVVAAQEIEFAFADPTRRFPVAADTPELYFTRDLLGYGWCFRKGEVVNIGLGRADRHELAAHVERFVEALGRARGLDLSAVANGASRRWRGHAYLLYNRSRRAVLGDGVVLVGDAAGLAYSQSGEGIRPAVESGLMAADAIIRAGGRYDRHGLQTYRRALASRFGSRRRSVVERLPRGLTVPLARALIRTRWFNQHVVLDRFFLHAGQPPLER